MRLWLSAIGCWLLVGGLACAQTFNNYTDYWTLNDNAANTTILATIGTNGTLVNAGNTSAVTIAGAAALSGAAFVFDGVNDHATLTNVDLSGGQDASFVFWARQEAYGTGNELVMEHTASIDTNNGGAWFTFEDATGTIAIATKGAVGYSTARYTRPSAGTWHHYVLTIDYALTTNEVNLYQDGVLLTPSSRPSNSNNTGNLANATTYLASRGGTSLQAPCKIDEFGVYDRVLTASDVTALYNSYLSNKLLLKSGYEQ
jgi:hypothetical protein